MFILQNYLHSLRFRIDLDAPRKYKKMWNNLKISCESGGNLYIIKQVLAECELEQNKNIPILNRMEGGIGGNNNIENKQIRFRYCYYSDYLSDEDIVLDVMSTNDYEKWTYEELDDLISAFVKVFNMFVEETCISGYINLEKLQAHEK